MPEKRQGRTSMGPYIKRREALIGLAAGAGLLAAGETALAQSGPHKGAPALAELVKAGKLPPVEARLPEKPLVVPVVEKVGEYGGGGGGGLPRAGRGQKPHHTRLY